MQRETWVPRILLVDDEAENLNSLRRYLLDNAPDWEVDTARSENEAIGRLNGDPTIDVVITDLVMITDQGGIDVLRTARSRDPLAMVIVITAFEKKLDRYQAFELGAFDCVQKNTPGLVAAEEILVKTRAALRVRSLAIQNIADQKRLAFLRRYFDPKVFGAIEKDPALLELKTRTVTIAFWDIRGFSRLSETLKAYPELITGFLNDYFQAATEVVFEHDGVLDKFIGDGVMALFGALGATDGDDRRQAENAVRSALEFRVRFASVIETWLPRWTLYTPEKISIGLGCGIHTGESLVGNVGTEIRDQYTALGPHVNFASRLESRAGAGQILISSSTAARLPTAFEVVETETLSGIKNIAGEFIVSEVRGRKV